METQLIESLTKLGVNNYLASAIIITTILLVAVLANFLTKKVILTIVARIIKKTKTEYDDVFLEQKVFTKLSHLVPAIIIYYAIPLAFFLQPEAVINSGMLAADQIEQIEFNKSIINAVQSFSYIYMIVVVMIFLNSFLNSLNEIYTRIAKKKEISLSIKGYLQVIKILFIIAGIILIIAVLLDKKPGAIFAGLGALAAVLLLVFKDTILGFMASIQLSAYKMVKVGDWITMPSRKADGDVLDISLNTVKVQNFDKTITTIPTYAMVSESFTNWTGMQESGGRRIKRSINIDMKTIRFCTPEMLEKFKKIQVLKDYIQTKENEIKKYNEENGIDNSILVNGRRLTNIGIFRKYIEEYLRKKQDIKKDFTFLIRQLKPDVSGLPLEIYVFTDTTNWVKYEGIQADVFDHLLAVLPEFGLQPFQNPSGSDFANIIVKNTEN